MKKISKYLALILAVCLLTASAQAVSKEVQDVLTYSDIQITLDGQRITPADVNGESTEPFILNDSVYLPLRAVAESLGLDVQWNVESGTVAIQSAPPVEIPEGMRTVAADDAMNSILAIGFVDADGSKLNAIALEYNVELDAKNVDLSCFAVSDYGTVENPACELGRNPGQALTAYVNNAPEVSSDGGTQRGRYVIIEVNSSYQLSSVPNYEPSAIAGVRQVRTILTDTCAITPSVKGISNYTMTEREVQDPRSGRTVIQRDYDVQDGSYMFTNISGYQLFRQEDGTAFHATHCWDERYQEYMDVDLPYALFVPGDYHEDGKYALVLHVHDAGFMGTDPMITLTEGAGPADFASDKVQAIAKANGLDGIIVLCPQIWDDMRCTRGGYTISAGIPATWQLMDYLTETYSIDTNRIYGTGQSMGGMMCMAMATHRDNYFAGLWLLGCQWGSDFNKEVAADGFVHVPSKDATIWTTDADGNDSDYGQNVYYLVSDDNILSTNCVGDTYSSGVWKEMRTVYKDLTGVEFPYSTFSPLNLTLEQQNAAVENLLAQENKTGIYWFGFDGGNHMLTWVYAHKLMAGYEWLLTQTRESENARPKLSALNAPWVEETDSAKIAASRTEDRYVGKDTYGNPVYFALAAEGAGTIGYNTARYGKGGSSLLLPPGWTPEDAEEAEVCYGIYKGAGQASSSAFYINGSVVEYPDRSYTTLTEGTLYQLTIRNGTLAGAVEQTLHYDNKVVATLESDCFTNTMGDKTSSNFYADSCVVVDAARNYAAAQLAVGDTVDVYFTSRGDGNTYGVYYIIILSHA